MGSHGRDGIVCWGDARKSLPGMWMVVAESYEAVEAAFPNAVRITEVWSGVMPGQGEAAPTKPREVWDAVVDYWTEGE